MNTQKTYIVQSKNAKTELWEDQYICKYQDEAKGLQDHLDKNSNDESRIAEIDCSFDDYLNRGSIQVWGINQP